MPTCNTFLVLAIKNMKMHITLGFKEDSFKYSKSSEGEIWHRRLKPLTDLMQGLNYVSALTRKVLLFHSNPNTNAREAT